MKAMKKVISCPIPLSPPCLQRSTFVKYTRRAPQIRMNAQRHNSTGADLGEAGAKKQSRFTTALFVRKTWAGNGKPAG